MLFIIKVSIYGTASDMCTPTAPLVNEDHFLLSYVNSCLVCCTCSEKLRPIVNIDSEIDQFGLKYLP